MAAVLIKGVTLFAILLYASIKDIRYREVPDYVSVMLLILAVVGFEPAAFPSMLIGAAAVFLPQWIAVLIAPNKALGGADMKISTAAAFLLGLWHGLLAFIIGLALAVIIVSVVRCIKRKNNMDTFPLVPFLSIGIFTAYILSNLEVISLKINFQTVF